MSEWVDIKEREPDMQVEVLVRLSNCGHEVDCMEYDDSGAKIWAGSRQRSTWIKVTDWMEIPD